jgi:hypothetical protein
LGAQHAGARIVRAIPVATPSASVGASLRHGNVVATQKKTIAAAVAA